MHINCLEQLKDIEIKGESCAWAIVLVINALSTDVVGQMRKKKYICLLTITTIKYILLSI